MRKCIACDSKVLEVKKYIEIHKKKYPIHLICDYNIKKKIKDEEKKITAPKLGRPRKKDINGK